MSTNQTAAYIPIIYTHSTITQQICNRKLNEEKRSEVRKRFMYKYREWGQGGWSTDECTNLETNGV